MGVVNLTERVVDLMYDPKTQRPGESGYRYKVTGGSPVYFYESDLETPEEVKARRPSDDEKEPEYIYDGDTGTAFINGQWRIVSQTQWERWQRQ
jgi:hypothetical protein